MNIDIFLLSVAWLATITSLLNIRRLGVGPRLTLCISIGTVAILPIDGLALVGYIRGFTGDLSYTTNCLLASSLLYQLSGHRLLTTEEKWLLYKVLVGTGLLLYFSSLGLSRFSLYDAAFQNAWYIIGLFALALFAWYRQLYYSVCLICLCLIAYNLHLLESDNLWDYLIDPLLTMYCFTAICFRLMAKIRFKNVLHQKKGQRIAR